MNEISLFTSNNATMGLFWVESNVNGLGESKRSKKLKVDDGKNWRS